MVSDILEVALVSLDWDLIDLIESIDSLKLIGVFDRNAEAAAGELLILGADSDWPGVKKSHPGLRVILGIDPPALRKTLFAQYGADSVVELKAPTSHVSHRAVLDDGVVIQRGVEIMPQARLGKACKLHLNVTVHHGVKIGDFCTIGPSAQLLGNVEIGECAYIGAGVIIKQRCRIGRNATIGAGAVVLRDVPDNATVAGVPAKSLS